MKKIISTIILLTNLLITLSYTLHASNDDIGQINFNYFGTPISIQYSKDMIAVPWDNEISEQSFRIFRDKMQTVEYFPLLSSLFYTRNELHLNDWCYYLLLVMTANQLYPTQNDNYKTLFTWFFMEKAGYTVQLNYVKDEVILSVYTTDEVYDLPRRPDEVKGWFIDISSHFRKSNSISAFKTNFFASSTDFGKSFSFAFRELPALSSASDNKMLTFKHDNVYDTLRVQINPNVIKLMTYYPQLSIGEHACTPLSQTAYASLLPQLRERIKTRTNYEAIRYLLSFTRQAFKYETDLTAYNIQNLTFSAEQTLNYPASDCEDRAILFVTLVKELLGLDVVLLDFSDHASAAVCFGDEQVYGSKIIKYKGKQFTICEPTGPGNHLQPGDFPEGLEEVSFGIIDPYRVR